MPSKLKKTAKTHIISAVLVFVLERFLPKKSLEKLYFVQYLLTGVLIGVMDAIATLEAAGRTPPPADQT